MRLPRRHRHRHEQRHDGAAVVQALIERTRVGELEWSGAQSLGEGCVYEADYEGARFEVMHGMFLTGLWVKDAGGKRLTLPCRRRESRSLVRAIVQAQHNMLKTEGQALLEATLEGTRVWTRVGGGSSYWTVYASGRTWCLRRAELGLWFLSATFKGNEEGVAVPLRLSASAARHLKRTMPALPKPDRPTKAAKQLPAPAPPPTEHHSRVLDSLTQ